MKFAILGRLTLKELALKTWSAIGKHNCLGRAAELAFYFTLALFPLLIVLLNVISFMPGVQETILFWLSRLMPPDATRIVETWVQNVFANRSGGLVSFGLIFSLWAASTGMGALIAALNSAYEVAEGRPFWKAQLVALGLIIALCLLVIGGAVLITFGDPMASGVANLVGYQKTIGTIWLVIHYLTGLAMLILGMAVIYVFAPNVRQSWTWIVPGALFAAASLVSASYLFSLYIRYAPSYNAIYGSLGAVIVLMLWLYLMGSSCTSAVRSIPRSQALPESVWCVRSSQLHRNETRTLSKAKNAQSRIVHDAHHAVVVFIGGALGYWDSSCIKILFDEAVLQRFGDGPTSSNRPAYSTARHHSNYVMTAML